MAAPRRDAFAIRNADLTEIGTEHFGLDARDGDRHVGEDVAAVDGEHVGGEGRPVEDGRCQFDRRCPAAAEPRAPALVQLTCDCPELAHDARIVRALYATSTAKSRPKTSRK